MLRIVLLFVFVSLCTMACDFDKGFAKKFDGGPPDAGGMDSGTDTETDTTTDTMTDTSTDTDTQVNPDAGADASIDAST